MLGFPVTYYMFRDAGPAPSPELAPTVPVSVYAMFELAFALIPPSIIIAEISGKTSHYINNS
jgi:Amt family ammonium transporter